MPGPAEHIATVVRESVILRCVYIVDSRETARFRLHSYGLIRVTIWREYVWIILGITWLPFGQLGDGLLSLVLFRVSAEARVCRLIHGEVLCLDNDEVGQEREEEKWDKHADHQREVEHNLRYERVRLDYKRKETSFFRRLQDFFCDQNVNIYKKRNECQRMNKADGFGFDCLLTTACHDDDENEVNVL